MGDIYFAPMEGIVTATYRKVYRKYYKGVDRFYTPFLAANQNHKFRRREKQEYIPYAPDTVPQVLTSSAQDFLWAAGELSEAGYSEININMGCPSATVVTKGRGAGMLADKEKLDEFLYEIYSSGMVSTLKLSDPGKRGLDDVHSEISSDSGLKSEAGLPAVSIKTRIGMESHDEVYELIDIWKKYPIKEIIVHPRVRADFYENEPDLEAFEAICREFSKDYRTGADDKAGKPEGGGCESISDGQDPAKTMITYNGDIRSSDDVFRLRERFGEDLNIMIGRGFLIDPALAERIAGSDHGITDPIKKEQAGQDTHLSGIMESESTVANISTPGTAEYNRRLGSFLTDLWDEYEQVLDSERDVLFKMKELWSWLGLNFQEADRELKMIRKTIKKAEYMAAVREILSR